MSRTPYIILAALALAGCADEPQEPRKVTVYYTNAEGNPRTAVMERIPRGMFYVCKGGTRSKEPCAEPAGGIVNTSEMVPFPPWRETN
jgi:hypothetical protein